MTSTPSIVVFEPDLLFSSRIEGQARRIGADLRLVTDYDCLLRQLRANVPELLILNLDILETRLVQLQDFLGVKSRKSVGYYSYMNARLGEEARRLGIGLGMSRGAFVTKMKEVFASFSGVNNVPLCCKFSDFSHALHIASPLIDRCFHYEWKFS